MTLSRLNVILLHELCVLNAGEMFFSQAEVMRRGIKCLVTFKIITKLFTKCVYHYFLIHSDNRKASSPWCYIEQL